jgi:hypothetical protein
LRPELGKAVSGEDGSGNIQTEILNSTQIKKNITVEI